MNLLHHWSNVYLKRSLGNVLLYQYGTLKITEIILRLNNRMIVFVAAV